MALGVNNESEGEVFSIPSVFWEPIQRIFMVYDHSEDNIDILNELQKTQQNKRHWTFWVYSAMLVFFFYTLSVILPVFSKTLFDGYRHKWKGYNYPLTATWLQMIGSCFALFFLDCAHYLWKERTQENVSWSFGPGFWSKCWKLFWVSADFAAVMALTNLAISSIPVDTHVIIQSSEIMWTVFFAWLIQGERPTIWELGAVFFLTAGVFLEAFDFGSSPHGSYQGLLINIAATIAMGLMLPLLRRAIVDLEKEFEGISPFEVTFIKFVLSTLLMAPFTIGLELGAWNALLQSDWETQVLVITGVFITFIFQTTVIALTFMSLAVSVGILLQTAVIPSYILAAVYSGNATNDSPIHVIGLVLVGASALFYAWRRWVAFKAVQQQRLESNLNSQMWHVEENSALE